MAGPHGLFPYLVVSDAKAAIHFYTKAFGASEVMRHSAPNSDKLMHVHMTVFGSAFYFADDFPEHMGGKSRTPQAIGGTPITLHLQVDDARRVWDSALAHGATVVMPLADQFWGDRYGQLRDPFGHEWSIGQTLKTLSDAEVEKAAEVAFKL
jgi:PhnB protein